MAAPIRGHDHGIAGRPRKRAVVHTRAGCDGQRSGVTAVVLPWVGLRGDVLHLQFLLPGAGLLRGEVPTESAAATAAACQPALPAKRGRPARSPRPPTGLPATLPPEARDRSHFRRQWPMGQDLGAIEGNGNERFIDEEIARQAPVGAAAKRPPAGLHPVRAWGACWREENRPGEVETMIPKKDENGEKYATATTGYCQVQWERGRLGR